MTNKFEEVSALEFATYLDDIKQRLLKEAPEWHINIQFAPGTPRIVYHLARWDFTKGQNQTWPIRLSETIFAFEMPQEDATKTAYFLFNHHPIGTIK